MGLNGTNESLIWVNTMDAGKLYNYLCANYSNMVEFSEKLFRENLKQYEKNLFQVNSSCDFSTLNPFKENAYILFLLEQIELTYTTEELRKSQLNESKISIQAFKRNQKKSILEGRYEKSGLKVSKDLCLCWIEDSNKLNLYDYAYLEELRPHIQISCIIKSLIYICLTEGSLDTDAKMMFFPDEVMEDPLFSIGLAKRKPLHIFDKKSNKISFYYENQTSEGNTVRYTREVDVPNLNSFNDEELEEMAEQYELSNSMAQFNTDDWAVYTLFYQLITLDICNTSIGVFNIDDLCERLPDDSKFDPNSKNLSVEISRLRAQKKQKIYTSLRKFQTYNVHISHITSSGKNESVHDRPLMVASLSWYEESAPEENPELLGKAVIQFELSFLERWLNKQTDAVLDQMVSEDDYVSVSSQTRQLMFFFQRERIKALNGNNMYANISWTYIKERFPYGGKNVTMFRNIITSCLDECSLKGIIVQNYTANRSIVSINFLPLSDAERKAYNL